MHQALKRALETKPFREFPLGIFVVAVVMLAISPRLPLFGRGTS